MKPGPKEEQVRALRLARSERRPRAGIVQSSTVKKTGSFSARVNLDAQAKVDRETAPAAPAAAKPEESDVANKRKIKSKKKVKRAKAKKVRAAAKAPARRKPARSPVSAKDVAEFICRDGGASMAELTEKFGIEAHPMRAKIHYARHELSYAIAEPVDGRYTGTRPAAPAAETGGPAAT